MDRIQAEQVTNGKGFIAALDQSGGSTPKALRLYGVEESAYSSEAEMFDLIHEMRTRIVKSPAFTGDKIVGRDPVRDDDGPRDRRHALGPSTCGKSGTSCRS